MGSPLIDSKTISKLHQLLDGSRHIVITCHVSPDGDAVGSTLALCRVLRSIGKDAHVITPDQLPRSLSFVPGAEEIVAASVYPLRAHALVAQANLVFCLDFNTLKRIDKLGYVISKSRVPKVLIDHHLNPDGGFDVSISFPNLSSTCELVWHAVSQLGYHDELDKIACECLYVGMATDTGNFTYSSSYPEIYEVLLDLMRHGIRKEWLYNQAMNTFSEDCLRLQSFALLEKMKVYPAQHAALITLTKDELERFNYHKGDTEGLVNKPLAIPEVHWSMFLREDPGKIKVSCRSQGDFRVDAICSRYFGGGGHKNASGGEFAGTMEDCVAVFHQILENMDVPEQINS